MKTTGENNRMIAEFMGVESFLSTDGSQLWVNIPFSSGLIQGRNYGEWATTWGDLDHIDRSKFGYLVPSEYHTSWDWLMDVVEKIESILFDDDNSFNVTIGATNYCVIQDSNGEVYESIKDYGSSKLETVYKAVCQFIEWYNENK